MHTQTCPFLYRDCASERIQIAHRPYTGPIPAKVWRVLCNTTLEMKKSGYFFPGDAMDAYQAAVIALHRVMDKLTSGEIVLRRATPATYLIRTAFNALYAFHKYRVQPLRRNYRNLENCRHHRGTLGEDNFDPDNFNAVEAAETPPDTDRPLAQSLLDALAAAPSAAERILHARLELNRICARLLARDPANRRIIAAFHAYVAENGNFGRMAARLQMSLPTLYRHWPRYLSTARNVLNAKSQSRKVEFGFSRGLDLAV